MLSSLRTLLKPRLPLHFRAKPSVSVPSPFRPLLESLEQREMLNASSLAAPALVPVQVAPAQVVSAAPATAGPVAQRTAQTTTMLPLNITSITLNQAGQLVANGTLGGTTFTAPVTLSTTPNPADPSCPILDLQLGPINLNLLGLVVTTSPICLDINAESGAGNLLGNLLCDVANSLNQGTPISTILSGLGSNASTVTNGLTSMLNGALSQVTDSSNASMTSTNILHLSLGPVNLNLLGLQVTLDNCNNGPVTVDITAQQGPGNLLGNLLGGLAHLLDSNASLVAIGNKLDKIAGEILHLI